MKYKNIKTGEEVTAQPTNANYVVIEGQSIMVHPTDYLIVGDTTRVAAQEVFNKFYEPCTEESPMEQ
jgi:hypothetical protein